MKKRSMKPHFHVAWLLPAVIVGLLIWFFAAVASLREEQLEVGRAQLEQAVRQAAVACYAAEGVYPPDTEYLQKHYGLQVDDARYVVFYEVFAENLMPVITVLEK